MKHASDHSINASLQYRCRKERRGSFMRDVKIYRTEERNLNGNTAKEKQRVNMSETKPTFDIPISSH